MIKIFIDSMSLRIDDKDSHRFRFSFEKLMIVLKNNSHVYSLFFEKL